MKSSSRRHRAGSLFGAGGSAGEYFGRIWTFRDMTEEYSGACCGRARERFRGLIENATDLIAVVDAVGCIEYHSPSAQRLLGYQPEEVLDGASPTHSPPGGCDDRHWGWPALLPALRPKRSSIVSGIAMEGGGFFSRSAG